MSTPQDPQFDKLRRLLALKRYEQPPRGYFDSFLAEFHRRQRTEPIRTRSWWEEWVEFLRGEPVIVARYALGGAIALLLCVNAFLLAQRPSASPDSSGITARDLWTPVPPPSEFASSETRSGDGQRNRPTQLASNASPQFVLDRVNISPASYDASGDF